jgi:hypothetical protein
MDTARYGDLINFYAMLDKPEKNIGGARKLADRSGRVIWPKRGIYFFRESGEQRFDTGVRSANGQSWNLRAESGIP